MTNDLSEFRCSPQQERLWALQQLHSGACYAQCEASLEGDLQPLALKVAIEQVVRRHEIFRTRFHQPPGAADCFQIIAEAPSFYWEVIDLKHLAPDAVRALALDQRRAAAMTDDIALRALLLTTGSRQHLLMLSLPALCADARTLVQLVAEISHFYAARFEQPEPLTETAQYIQFSEWQNEILAEEDAEAGMAYWRKQNLESPPPAILPFERPKTGASSSPAASFELTIDYQLKLGSLGIVTEQDRIQLEDALFACWLILSWRLSGQAEIGIERVFDGRKYELMRGICGPLARAIPLMARFRGDESFIDVCRRTRQAALDAADWQEYFTKDQAAGNTPDDTRGFGFEFIETTNDHRAGGVTWLISRCDVCSERYKLRLFCQQHHTHVTATFYYDSSLYSATVIERIASQFHQLLTDAMRRPQTAINELELLSQDEKRQLLIEFNATQKGYPDKRCLHQLFEDQAQRTPQSIALACGAEQMSYDELNQRANQFAHRLRGMGIGPEVIVGIGLERSPFMMIAMLAVLKAGAAYLPLDLSSPAERLRLMLDDARAAALITQSRQAERFGARDPHAVCRIICIDDEWARIALGRTDNPMNVASPDNLAYVIYTSGSTGQPKGAMIHHRGLVNYLSWCVERYDVAAGNEAPVHSPISFDLTVTSLFAPLLAGRCARLLPESQGAAALHQALLDHHDFSLVKLTPAHLEALSHVLPASGAAGRTRALVVGGEELKAESLAFWREHAPETRVINEYGPTETVVGCCVYEVSQNTPAHGATPIGRPIANTQIYVLDTQFNPVPAGVAGELYVGGAGLARGYLRRPDLTAEKFIPDLFSSAPGARLYRTGDLARRLLDGNLEYLGRSDHQVKIRGFRIELGEIESALRRHSAVREAVVVAHQPADQLTVFDDADGSSSSAATDQFRRFVKTWAPRASSARRLVAYLVSDGEPAPTAAELRDFLSASLPDYMIPSVFVALAALPINVNGKVDRRALPEPDCAQSQLNRPFAPPATPPEKALAQIWSQALGVAQVGLDDNFFELGGDSIRGLQVVARAQEQGIQLSIPQLFDRPTIRELASHETGQTPDLVEAMSPARTKSEPFSLLCDEDRGKLPARLDDAYPLSHIQAGVVFHTEHSPDAPLYHDIFSYHLQAPLNTELFDLALAQLVARHATLRSSFDLTNFSEPLQLVHCAAQASLHVRDLRSLLTTEQEGAFILWLEEEKKRRFDWSCPPHIRFFAHRLTDDSFYLTLSFHDSILDGWSTASLLTELLRRYFALLAGEPLPVEPLPAVSYRDFIALEREALVSTECRDYWAEKLRDCVVARLPRLTRLASDTVRRVTVVDAPISARVSDGLKNLARLARVPLKHVLLAAHLRVISALSGQSDVLTGLESNGRLEEADGEQTLGIHLNTLPFRLRLTGGSWIDLAQQVFSSERELLLFRRYPYAQMQKMHGGQPLFETIFNYTHFHVFQSLRDLHGMKILGGRGFGQRHYALSAEFNRDPVSDHVQLDLECDLGEAPRKQWEEIGACYARVLTAMADDPHARYERDSLLIHDERQRVLVEWNDTTVVRSDQRAIHQLIEEQAALRPEAIAVACGETTLSYRELNARANQLARHLRALGAGPEALAGIYLERSTDSVVAILGVLKSGAAYAPIDPAYPKERIALMLDDARAQMLLTQRRLATELSAAGTGVSCPNIVCLDEDWPAIAQQEDGNLVNVVRPENAAYVIYTSGSTGKPKGVVVSHDNLINSTSARRIYYRDPLQSFLLVSSLAFDSSVAGLFWTLCQGGMIALPQDELNKDVIHFTELIARHRISHLLCVPSLYAVLLEHGRAAELAALRTVIVAGEVCSLELVGRHHDRLPHAKLFNEYGPTEATVWSSVEACEWRGAENVSAPSIGRPIANARLYVLNDFMQPAPIGAPGRLFIAGGGIARGYLNQPSLTAEKFIPDPFAAESGARLYNTGDLARFLTDGRVEFLGRADDQVKIRGYRVELGEIEAAVRRHPAVQDVVVIAVGLGAHDPRLAAYVVFNDAPEPTPTEWRVFLKERLPDYFIPHYFVKLEALPMTPNGKIARNQLPAPDHAQLEEEQLAQILSRLEQLSEVEACELLARKKKAVLATL